jgi:hypothetical protein
MLAVFISLVLSAVLLWRFGVLKLEKGIDGAKK